MPKRDRRPRPRPLAACLGLALSAAPLCAAGFEPAMPERAPSTLVVTNCDDAGPGSLRDTIAGAVSGDTVDMSALACSTITLTGGEIAIQVGDLALLGPGQDALTIDAHFDSGIFSSSGSIGISDLMLTRGYTRPRGGCVYALGNVELTRVTVQSCSAKNRYSDTPTGYAGGGVFVGGNLTMSSSTLRFNYLMNCSNCGFDAHASGSRDDFQVAHGVGSRTIAAAGGGAYVGGDANVSGSTIYRNEAIHGSSGAAVGGGLAVRGRLRIADSTISSNFSFPGGYLAGRDQQLTGADHTISSDFPDTTEFGGGLYLYPGASLTMSGCTVAGNDASVGGGVYGGAADSAIADSTITGNFGELDGGALVIDSVHLTNSTIANNSAWNGGSTGGIIVRADSEIESSIIARNTSYVPAVSDLSSGGTPVTISGANNLVMRADATVTLPPDTLHDDPLLGALADNGGPTQTLALLPGSPAIDAGNDVAGLVTDQRGTGFPRVLGARADIGAYERLGGVIIADAIFADGFD